MLERISEAVIDWADGFGLLGLALVSSSEAAFQPVPPDLLVIPMSISADSTWELLAIFLVVSISSVIGSLGGYAIGLFGGRPILQKMAKKSSVSKLEALTERFGEAGVFIAAVSPIPYKAVAWAAGAGRMSPRLFIIAGLFGRGIRFGLEVLVIGLWGDEFIRGLESPVFWLISGLIALAAFIPLRRWWVDLDSDDSVEANSELSNRL